MGFRDSLKINNKNLAKPKKHDKELSEEELREIKAGYPNNKIFEETKAPDSDELSEEELREIKAGFDPRIDG